MLSEKPPSAKRLDNLPRLGNRWISELSGCRPHNQWI